MARSRQRRWSRDRGKDCREPSSTRRYKRVYKDDRDRRDLSIGRRDSSIGRRDSPISRRSRPDSNRDDNRRRRRSIDRRRPRSRSRYEGRRQQPVSSDLAAKAINASININIKTAKNAALSVAPSKYPGKVKKWTKLQWNTYFLYIGLRYGGLYSGAAFASFITLCGVVSIFKKRDERVPIIDKVSVSISERNATDVGAVTLKRISELGERYGFNVKDFCEAAEHLCPVEYHVELTENFLAKLRSCSSVDEAKKYLKDIKDDEYLPFLHFIEFDEKSDDFYTEIEDKIYMFLTQFWRVSGYFDESTWKGIEGRRHVTSTVSHNVGTPGAWYGCIYDDLLAEDDAKKKK
eukprot:GHVL01014479.1.p2 GENE.GHVL01014479.1~~GHVL01014479.1.p2  ORF type:complete len:348 (+),score=88.70 GHVL01014479.1:1813-2856(+)